jgi:hypothetical protein
MKSEKLSNDLMKRIALGEDTRPYKYSGSRIVFAEKCKYCGSDFYPRRKDQVYCSQSCRVQYCYKKNNYQYRDGSYKKEESNYLTVQSLKGVDKPQVIEDKNDGIKLNRTIETALGAASYDIAKNLFTKDENKPLKVKDIKPLMGQLNNIAKGINAIYKILKGKTQPPYL